MEPTTKPWWQSKTVIGVIVMGIVSLGAQFGLPGLTEADQVELVDLVLAGTTVVAGFFAFWGRVSAKKQIG